MATQAEVEEKLAELIARLDASEEGARSLSQTLPEPRTLALHVSDLGLDYWTELSGGRMGSLQPGRRERAHIRLRAASDDLVELIDGNGSLFSAYLAGRLRIDASLSDLLRLRKLIG